MNGYMPYTSAFIGATGEYPIFDYIDNTSNSLSSNINNTSNILETKINTTSNILETKINTTSNILETQIIITSNLIYKDANLNTIVKITAQNPTYPASGDPKEMRFLNVNNEYLTKIIQTGELFVYHPLSITPVGYSPGWWSVEGKIAFAITETQGLRFDVTNLQAATGASAITDTATASSAVAASGAGLAAAGTAGATAGGLIAGGDYGSVALGLAGGALFSTLGYLSYQAQVESNLNCNGFSNQAAQVDSNISNAYLLLTDNISNINIAKGFINCNISKQQFIPSLNTNQLLISNINVSNSIFLNSNNNYIYSSNTSNYLYTYDNSNTSNSSNNLFNFINITSNINNVFTSNINNKINVYIPSSNFWMDTTNSLRCYDLNIEKYVPSLNIGNNIKARSFQISTINARSDWITKNNILFNNEYINKPEILTFYMNNTSNYLGQVNIGDQYANSLIQGKNYNTSVGYWNYLPNNYNYIRYIAVAEYDLNVSITRILP